MDVFQRKSPPKKLLWRIFHCHVWPESNNYWCIVLRSWNIMEYVYGIWMKSWFIAVIKNGWLEFPPEISWFRDPSNSPKDRFFFSRNTATSRKFSGWKNQLDQWNISNYGIKYGVYLEYISLGCTYLQIYLDIWIYHWKKISGL